ncbi:MAG: exopolysaccharide transport family protein [Hyphomicrobiales bacterium]
MTPRDDGPTPVSAAINLADVLRGVARHKVLILGLALLSFGGSLAYVNYTKPTYTSEAQILIQNMETPFDRVQPQDVPRSDAGVDDRVVASQIAVLQSTDLGRRVVDRLKLVEKPEFNTLLKGVGPLARIRLALGFGEDPRLKTPEQRALGRYADELKVFQQPNSNVITVKFSSISPETAAAVANTLSETYLSWTRESQAQPTERARDWLATQIEDLRGKLARSEEQVEKFRAQAGLLQGTTTTLGTQEISELNTQITLAQAASTEARAKADTIRDLLDSKGSIDSSADVLASNVVQRLKEQRSDAVRRVAELSATYLPNHPRMIAAQGELASIDKQIRAEALKVVASLDDQARVADAREKSLRANLDKLKAAEASANVDDVKLKALERETAADRALLETMLSRYAEASSRQDQSAQPGLARIIQSASIPSAPSFPKRGPMVLLITLAGTALAVGLAFLMELMAAAARLAEQVAQPVASAAATVPMPEMLVQHGAPAAAIPLQVSPVQVPMPAAPSPGGQLVPIGTLAGAASPDAARTLLDSGEMAQVATLMSDWACVAGTPGTPLRISVLGIDVGSLAPAAAALGLGRHLAEQGRRAILVDLSNDASGLETLCRPAHGLGLSDLLTGNADFTKVIGRDTESPLHLFRFGADRSPRAVQLIAERVDSVLSALSQVYDAVIINLGGARSDNARLTAVSRCMLLLSADPSQPEVAFAARSLQVAGVDAIGTVRVLPPTMESDHSGLLRSA